MTTTMKAMVQDTYGPPEGMRLRDIDRPVIGDHDLLVRVYAAAVDPGVWHVATGMPYLIRAMGYGLRAPKVRVQGRDMAGCVEAVGKYVTLFKPGAEVFGTCDGSFAEFASAREDQVAPKPPAISFEQAAACPISASTALQGLRDAGQVLPGQTVLIIGAAGGIGTFAVQLAKAFGAEVTGVCSTTKMDLVRAIGADDVIDYTREDFADRPRRYNLIMDMAGHRSLSHLRRALTPKGTLVIVGGEGGGKWLGGFDRSMRAVVLSPFVKHTLCALASKENSATLRAVATYIEAGKLKPIVDRTYALSEVPKAIQYVEEGHARGKVVITM